MAASTANETALHEARKLANRRIGFLGHGIVFVGVGLFLLVLTGPFVTAIVMLAWGIGLACHGFFAVATPVLRRRWMRAAEAQAATGTFAALQRSEGRHARSLELLSASIAHEIRNPLTAARSLVAQIGEDPSRADNAEYARVALEELDRVERAVSHLLRFARDVEIDLQDVVLADVLEGALESCKSRVDRLGVEVVRELDAFGAVRVDPEKLRRVIANLIGNALDALESSRTPGPRIDLALGENLAGNEVWLRVRDNGPGIPRALIDKIFTPFHTSKESGTGLGLALSRKIVEAHGGTLEARSEPGRGAELTLVLPRRPEPR